jgi:flagellar operon protein
MKVSDFNREVNLLEIVNRGKMTPQSTDKTGTTKFKDTFSAEMAKTRDINFSKHARERLFSRGIDLSNDKLTQLADAFDRAADKGSQNTLILDKDAAYVASIPNRTIITAFSRDNLREGVFTSIDSAVILQEK